MTIDRIDVGRLLSELGIEAVRDRNGRAWSAKCPAHDDRNPSWKIVDDGGPKTGSHKCQSCGFSGGPWELVARVKDISLEDAGLWVKERVLGLDVRLEGVPEVKVRISARRRFALPWGVQLPETDGTDWHPTALSYLLDDRRVTREQLTRWNIGFAVKGRLAWRIVVPVETGGRLVTYSARGFLGRGDSGPRYMHGERRDGAGVGLFGEPRFDRRLRAVTVTEGVFKMLAMERAGAPNPCAILGASNEGPEVLLAGWDLVLVATDPDPAGDKAADRIASVLARHVGEVRRVHLEVAPDDADADYLASAVALARRRRIAVTPG